jgi:Rieske Fe-S protein
MKKLVLVAAMASALTACGTTGTGGTAVNTAPPAPVKENTVQTAQANQATVQAAQMSNAVSQAPEWMSKLPKAPGYVFENGTATSTDFGFADIKAKTIAYSKICTAAGGKVRSQTKMYKSDNGDTGTEQSEMAIRTMCPDVDLTGVETVEMKHVADGNRIRTYVLVALPTAGIDRKETKRGAKEAFKELDGMAREHKEGTPVESPSNVSKPAEVSVVKPANSPASITLLPVDNEEYRQRRDEALKKPGAVIGQTTLTN